MFKINLKAVNLGNDINVEDLVDLTDGYSGADIANVCREAAYMPMRKLIEKNNNIDMLLNNPDFKANLECPIVQDDLLAAVKNISKSVAKSDLEEYVKWTSEFKST